MKLLMVVGLGSVQDLVSEKKGAFYYTLEEFSKYWDRIDIICPRVKGQNSKVIFNNVHIHVSSWPLIFHPIWFIRKGLQIYKEQKFDFMTVHEFPPFYNGIGARLLWQKVRIPYLLEIHHIPGYPRPSNLRERIYRIFMYWFIKFDTLHARAIRVVNQYQTPKFLIRAGVPKDKIIYIPSMYIDLDIFRPTDSQKEYDLIFVGRLEKNKGLELFVDAAIKTNARALIVGDGSLASDIKTRCTKYTNIVFHGWANDQREIAELINKSVLLVMPSNNEGGPRVVLEAMACGVPVLATNVGLMPDLAHKNAIKIIDWDAEDIAQKARELLGNKDERDRLSRASLEISRQFEKKTMIRNYADNIKALI